MTPVTDDGPVTVMEKSAGGEFTVNDAEPDLPPLLAVMVAVPAATPVTNPDASTTAPAVQGYRTAMTYVLQLASDPHFGYSADLLRSLHYMILS